MEVFYPCNPTWGRVYMYFKIVNVIGAHKVNSFYFDLIFNFVRHIEFLSLIFVQNIMLQFFIIYVKM